MNYEVDMPSLGADMEKGKFVEWKVKVGDTIKKGQPLAVVETEKAAVEIESFRNGKMLELLSKPGEIIKVGAPIARMEVEGAETETTVTKGVTPPEAQSIINIREVIGRQMAKSKKEIPHYYLKTRIKLERLMLWLDEQNQKKSPEERLLIPVVMLKAVTAALKNNSDFNGFYLDGKFQKSIEIHAGIAVALRPSGVVVPALLDAHTLSLDQMNRVFKDLVERTRSGGLKNREMTDASITITNVGDLGSDEVFGIIFPPQVALIGLGKIRKEAVSEGDTLKSIFVIDVSLSADHRVTDGLSGAKFLADIDKVLNNPQDL